MLKTLRITAVAAALGAGAATSADANMVALMKQDRISGGSLPFSAVTSWRQVYDSPAADNAGQPVNTLAGATGFYRAGTALGSIVNGEPANGAPAGVPFDVPTDGIANGAQPATGAVSSVGTVVTAIPEPSPGALLIGGIAAIGLSRVRRSRR